MLVNINNDILTCNRYIVSTPVDGIYEVGFSPGSANINVCDGEWHKALFQNKLGVLSILLDGSTNGNETAFSLSRRNGIFDLTHQLSVGGIPATKLSDFVRLLEEDSRSFGGCMRNFSVNHDPISLHNDVESTLNVDLDGCPVLLHESNNAEIWSGESSGERDQLTPVNVQETPVALRTNNSCSNAPIEVLYRGTSHNHTDDSVEGAFTRYLYKVCFIVKFHHTWKHFGRS